VTVPRLPRLAELFEVIEAQTPYGGRSLNYERIGSVWIRLGPVRRRSRSEAGEAETTETLTAEGRSDPRLTAGRLLRFSGADWRIVATETVGGRAILNLERTR
jgi:hypothetical protein